MSGVMSTAEAYPLLPVRLDGYYYGDGSVSMRSLVQNLLGAVMKENKDDLPKLKDYFNGVVRLKAERQGGKWKEYYDNRTWLK